MPWAMELSIAVLVVGLVGMFAYALVMYYVNAEERPWRIQTLFKKLGGVSKFGADPHIQVAAHNAVAGIEPPGGARGIQWYAQATVDGEVVTVYEHVDGSCEESQDLHGPLLAVMAVPAPRRWPGVSLTHTTALNLWSSMLGRTDFEIGDASFDHRWHIAVEDENFAWSLLVSQFRDATRIVPAPWSIYIGHGSIAICRHGPPLSAEEIASLMPLLPRLLRAVPAELTRA